MGATIRPWGPAAVVLAGLGLLTAFLVDVRALPLGLGGLGLVATALGLCAGRGGRGDRSWLLAGGVLSAAVCGLALVAPLIPRTIGQAGPAGGEAEPGAAPAGELLRVPRERPLDPGKPLADGDWADAATEALRRDDWFLRVESARAGRLPGLGGTSHLLVHFFLYQNGRDRTITFTGFAKGARRPALTDAAGRSYAFAGHQPRRFSPAFDLVPLRLDHFLVFALPPADSGPLKLEIPASAWGETGTCRFLIKEVAREAAPDLVKLTAHYRNLLRRPPRQPPDPSLGRALFFKNCMECHTLFGAGNKVGPDLTASKRNDLDFLVTSVANPSAEIAKGFEPWVVVTASGQIYTGIIKEQTAAAVTLQTASRKVVLPRDEIDELRPSKVSLMPTELLKPFSEHEVRSLFAYLSGKAQVPMLATEETAVYFSAYGQTLMGWRGVRGRWRVAGREIVAPGPAAGRPALLVHDLLLRDDFHVTLKFHPGAGGGGAVWVRAEGAPDGAASGARVGLTVGERVTLVGGDGKRAGPGEAGTVQPDAWNQLELIAVGRGLRVRLNGRDAAVLEDAHLPARRVIALEGPDAAGQSLRFANLDLRLLSEKKQK